ncbi:MAG: hypothetical protein AVDCRST_MAG19-3004, partial [uncultured Thermomicrobiales bacterium]
PAHPTTLPRARSPSAQRASSSTRPTPPSGRARPLSAARACARVTATKI